MAIYEYSRTCINNCFKIDNPERLDGELKQIHIAKETEIGLPDKKFVVRCNGTDCNFIFENDLIKSDKDRLDVIVSNHINNTINP